MRNAFCVTHKWDTNEIACVSTMSPQSSARLIFHNEWPHSGHIGFSHLEGNSEEGDFYLGGRFSFLNQSRNDTTVRSSIYLAFIRLGFLGVPSWKSVPTCLLVESPSPWEEEQSSRFCSLTENSLSIFLNICPSRAPVALRVQQASLLPWKAIKGVNHKANPRLGQQLWCLIVSKKKKQTANHSTFPFC
jgi:hypothetical protein